MPVRALARINLAAIARNARRLQAALAPGAELGVVVKADGYGHGAVPVAREARRAGATWVAVASAQEAAELREGGLEDPLLILGALSADELPVALQAGADVVAWTGEFVRDLERAAGRASQAPVGVHVKLDTGMGRFGTRDASEALALADRLSRSGQGLALRGAMTHFATADNDPEFLAVQLARFEPFVQVIRTRWPATLIHAANSAALLRAPESHFDLVRCGIALYGYDPMGGEPSDSDLEPALELTSYVAALKDALPGDSVGYGRTFTADQATRVATVPIGYADGLPRVLSNNSQVLIRGRSYPVVGTISMDNLTVDVGSAEVELGDRVTIIGCDGAARRTAEDLARWQGTISWEVLCAISARVPRSYHRDGAPA